MRLALLQLKQRLDSEIVARNRDGEISYEKPDPILVAHRYRDEWSALICALFGYGRAGSIVRFLDTLDMDLLNQSEADIRNRLTSYYYRFQSAEDVIQLFIALRRLKAQDSLEAIFKKAYISHGSVSEGLYALMESIVDINKYESPGYRFLIGRRMRSPKGASTMKRWLMYLRWMVRNDAIDMGLWQGVSPSDLIIPLDTHTFNVSRKLGLLERRRYDLQAAIELTETLRRFDPDDPVKYDFALYRMGQERMV